LTRKKEGLASLKEGEVKMYLCGITPYNEPHLGHARCYLTLVEERNKAQANKDWAKADLFREELRGLGVILKDTPRGTRWKRARFLINDSTLSLRSEGD